MKNILKIGTVILIGVVGISTTAQASDVLMRYNNTNANMQLSIKQDVYTGTEETLRSDRLMNLNLAIAGNNTSNDIAITINKAGGFINVHGQTQRISGSYLTNFTFPMKFSKDHRSLKTDPDNKAPDLDLGQSFAIGLPIGGTLVDVFPILPAAAVSVGSTWNTTNDFKILEGWSWAKGIAVNNNEVTAIDVVNGHQMVSVKTNVSAKLEDANSARPYGENGALTRTTLWMFDATDGRLVSLEINQTSNGFNHLQPSKPPLAVRQETNINFSPIDGRPE